MTEIDKKDLNETDNPADIPPISLTEPVKPIFSRIGLKLIFLILVGLAISMGSLFFLTKRMIADFGEYAVSINEKNIKEKTTLLLSEIIDARVMRNEDAFRQIALSSSLVAGQAGMLLDDMDRFVRPGFVLHNLSYNLMNKIYSNSAAEPIQILYWGNRSIPETVLKELDVLSTIGPLLVQLKENMPRSAAAYIVTESSLTLYYPNLHFVEKLKPIREYEIKRSIWYQRAMPANNPEKKTVWTRIYQDEGGLGLMTSAVSPIYSGRGKFLGVAGIDVTLHKIIKEVLKTNALEGEPGHMKGMFSFILDDTAKLIAFPEQYLDLFGLPSKQKGIEYGSVFEHSLLESSHPQVKAMASQIISKEKQNGRINLNQMPFLISSRILPSTGWFLCIVIPESSVLSSVFETRDAIDSSMDKMNYRFTWLSVALLVVGSFVIIIFLSRQLIIPLNRLILGAARVKEGDLTVKLPRKNSKDEMGLLIQTFNTMVEELNLSDKREKNYTRTLQTRVKERTAELLRKNKEQAHTLALLEKESRERNEIQEKLKESQEKYKDIFENSVEGIFQSTPDNKLLNANPAMAGIWGYESAKQMLAMVDDIEKLYVDPDDRKKFIRMVEQNRTVSGHEVQCMKKDGSKMWISLSARAVMDEQGTLTHILGSCVDISKKKQAEKDIQRASRMEKEASLAKSRFLATMSHEIRTPMNAIIGMTEMAIEKSRSTEQRKHLEVVSQSSEHLLQLIDDILDISAIETKKIHFYRRPFDLDSLIAGVVRMFRDRADQKGISLSYEINNIPVNLKGDQARLRQIMVNLVNNAIKFTREGTIQIQVEPAPTDFAGPGSGFDGRKQDFLFSVSDTGIGIPEKDIENIFKEFTQLESSLTRTYGGTGLGLSICRKLVELMGGKIWVKSRENQGSTFYFTISIEALDPDEFPVCTDPSLFPAGERVHQVSRDTLKGIHVLLAEDFEVNRQVIIPVLQKHGIQVTVATNGRQALEAVREHEFDMILMDVQMPEMDGLEAASAIRSLPDPVRAATPIIALTAHALKGDRERFLSFGMDEYLSKPLRGSELIRIISKLLNDGRIERDITHHVCTENFDPEHALSLADNDPELLRTTINAIVEHLPETLDRMERLVEAKDWKTASRLAHSIKSAAGSVGETTVSDTAYVMEEAGSKGHGQVLVSNMPRLKRRAGKMMQALTRYIGSSS